LKLRDIMTREVVVVSEDMTLRRALELFAQRHITGAPVVKGMTVVGVVSTTDLLTFVASAPERGEEAEDTNRRAGGWDELPPGESDGLPSLEEENEPAATYFTELWSAPSPDAEARLRVGASGALDVLEEHTVDEVMTRDVVALPPDTAVTAAAVAADFHQPLDVHRDLLAEVSFDAALFLDHAADAAAAFRPLPGIACKKIPVQGFERENNPLLQPGEVVMDRLRVHRYGFLRARWPMSLRYCMPAKRMPSSAS